jgi:hypothetical protein
MARETTADGADSIAFELDRFELTADDRLELTGRWFGVRGRRFVRPTLTALADGPRCRLLASLDDKPWSAEDGDLWRAAFPWEAEETELPQQLELAVAPDIAVALPPPGEVRGQRATRQRPRSAGRAAARATEAPTARDAAEARRGAEQARQEAEEARREAEGARREAEDARRQLQAARVQISAANSRRDTTVSKLEAVIVERDEAMAALADLRAGHAAALRTGREAAQARADAAQARDAQAQACVETARLEDELRRASDLLAEGQAERRGPVQARETTRLPVALTPVRPSSARSPWRRHGQPEVDWVRRGTAVLVLLVALVALAAVLRVI